jgi:predicted Zn-dependent protease
MSGAAEAEDKTDKHVVTPGPLAPARELYGQMLLERGKAAEALVAFEATMRKEPNRFHGYAGAAMTAERLGDKAAARLNYDKLLTLVAGAEAVRPEIARARGFIGRK